jgi:glycine/D-amino acid oxidase-like deaminating enzyme
MLIWLDPQDLDWSEAERSFLSGSEDNRALLERFPPGVHLRPEGMGQSTTLLMIWNYHTRQRQPVFPIQHDPEYPEVLLRGLTTMLPGLRAYYNRAPRPLIDGGYYTKTRENRPLIGPLPVEGAYLIGALSGFGVMASVAAGELLAAHITGNGLPAYAAAFALERYQDPQYLQQLAELDRSAEIEL